MPKFEKLNLPKEGELITFNQGKPNVPNNPIVPYICLLYTSPSPRDRG